MPTPAQKTAAYTQFAVWLQLNHPALFAQLASVANKSSQLGRIYRDSFAHRRSQQMGDYYDFADFGSDASDFSNAFADTPISVDLDIPEMNLSDSLLSDMQSPSIADSISAETQGAATLSEQVDAGAVPALPPIQSAASIPTMPPVQPSSSASSVGSTLAANAGLITASLNAANTIITSNTAAQVIQAQAQRAAAGLAPANVGYQTYTDPTTGAVSLVPVLNGANGQLPLNTAGINALSPATFLQNYGLYIMLGLAALVVAMD